jgi:hypothetical protein
MVMVFLYNGTAGSKYLEYNPGSELNLSLVNKEYRKAKNQMRTRVKQRINEKLNNEQNNRQQQ